MPWTNQPLGGFTTGHPWLPLSAQNLALSVDGQEGDKASLLNETRRLLALRKASPALRHGKLKKLVEAVEHVTFSGPRGIAQGQDITYVTERCVLKLTPEGIVLTEIAPGVDLQAHILDQSEFALAISPDLKLMDARLFTDAPTGLTLAEKAPRTLAEAAHG